MSSTSEIWFAFARTFSVLFVVLALLILIFYVIKKISVANNKKSGSYIQVLSMHHLSPKEKLVLVDVLGETILVGVTPNQISKLTSIKTDMDFAKQDKTAGFKFSDYLGQKLGRSPHIKPSQPEPEGPQQ